MSVPVPIDELLAVVQKYEAVPLALTVDDDGRARAAAVRIEWPDHDEEQRRIAVLHCGHRTTASAQSRPLVSLIWPAPAGERFALLVDGRVTGVELDPPPADPAKSRTPGGRVTLELESAILHVMQRH